MNAIANGNANFPPPKTDKPRPHVCGTCGRSFARLEHLKRHERSHTKEKPFECPECTRCFARRDLLLRHQQKLHMSTTPSSRPRSGRRESTSSSAATASGRVRKNSTVNNTGGATGGSSMRPRANTISHVDNATLGMLAAANSSAAKHARGTHLGHSQHPSLNGFAGPGSYEFRGMSTSNGHHGNPHGLPKISTQGLNIDIGGGLRTAPPFGDWNASFDMGDMLYGPGNTINPAHLHFTDSTQHSLTYDTPTSPFQQAFSGIPPAQASLDDDGNFDWMHGFEAQMSFDNANEHALAGSSPSAISTGSRSGISEVMLDGSNNNGQTSEAWQDSILSQAPMSVLDISGFSELPGPLSSASLQDQFGGPEQYFSPGMPMNYSRGLAVQYVHQPMNRCADTPTNSAASVSSSNRQSSVTSVSTDSITEATRQALLASLSNPLKTGQNHRKFPHPAASSPLSPGFSARLRNVSLPSTYDLQRYVSAYIQYFHPHLPFLHIPSLSFDSPAYTSHIRSPNGNTSFQDSSIAGGGGCLVLAMAAIGAFYEFDNAASKELFELAKKMIKIYLEERRKADMAAVVNGPKGSNENLTHNTPIWLVQAMLLNVIYGHNCGDKTSAENAATHCAALVSLARAAELTTPYIPGGSPKASFTQQCAPALVSEDVRMGEDGWIPQNGSEAHDEWHTWKLAEERRRTLYAVFILSSVLVSAYNHAPALTNSEIRLDLPCDEDIWAADSPDAWYALGGNIVTEHRATPFAAALSSLLTASQRHHRHPHQIPQIPQIYGSPSGLDLPPVDFQPSTFGCLVLINALHNYIWETRQRHLGRQWTTLETESMHAHIEPALAAWQAAWASNPQHSMERPNPFGLGPLSADCIPMLDLAYVRLFVNLGCSKEAFWQHDFEAMAEELARGIEIVQHAECSPQNRASNDDLSTGTSNTNESSPVVDVSFIGLEGSVPSTTSQHVQSSEQCSKHERHLRKAAFHAAHSLSLSDRLGVSFANFNSRELPMSSALCVFDCAQVLAEWVSTVQERVGRYLGVLGKDVIDFGQVPGIMLLEDEDCKLLEKIDEVLNNAEVKMAIDHRSLGIVTAHSSGTGFTRIKDCGYGSKLLLVTAYMMEKSAVWPSTYMSINGCVSCPAIANR